VRFNKQVKKQLENGEIDGSLGTMLEKGGYSKELRNRYLIPMGAAIWSAKPEKLLEFPAETFMRFFNNHGLLDIKDRPQWYTIKDGSRSYVTKMIEKLDGKIRLNTAVKKILRDQNKVNLFTDSGEAEIFDHVILASHSEQSLAIMGDASPDEKRILGQIEYQPNTAILHTDHNVLPKSRKAWASWNYHLDQQNDQPVAVTYNMNILQRLETEEIYCVTLNRPDLIDPKKIIKTIKYDHPVYNRSTLSSLKMKGMISGVRNTWYAGAYWGNGFHEDGVNSALDVCQHFGVGI
ncbi:FAD-dependent oxidoreductase, partial [bacterium]|nr:FAD-dependent oxidoreductase [bacterium]